ncbi:MAG: phosphoribosylanthranilate isomerase [Polaribacter sp.]|jgi:phosphoribosylanthranilate isomerase|nr:phosphoribosylanthranilate isomerase [Polaribacter sp.]MDG1953813.1 phosphoribosylanthranilate isomerase [Polaribacter sp.]MDG2073363.1 phosphoribosylanthranilate isomerase [Polaribacter sp.]
MKLKVCGMKYVENIQQVAELQPDYLGFIFYDKSKRNFDGIIPELSQSIKKIGVFVNPIRDEVVSKVDKYNLQAVQLHGDESVEYIKGLKKHLPNAEIIKVFGIKDEFDFNILNPYLEVVDYFLFDTKGKERGGNGITFDWKMLENYPFSKPFFLSGGIGLDQVQEINKIRKTDLPIYALDINSQFEIEAGLKSVENIKKFKDEISTK